MNPRTLLPAVLAALLAPSCAMAPGEPWTPPSEAPLPAGFPAPSRPGEVVVKEYPAFRGVHVKWEGDLDAGMNRCFWPLFDHIRSNDIAMSTPVLADYSTDPSRSGAGAMDVAFLYADPSREPTSVDDEVRVSDTPAQTVLSIGVEGRYDLDVMRPALARLRSWLAANGAWREAGAPRRLFYQRPIFWKGARIYSEVQIRIEPVKAL
jgi:hypothetical protein